MMPNDLFVKYFQFKMMKYFQVWMPDILWLVSSAGALAVAYRVTMGSMLRSRITSIGLLNSTAWSWFLKKTLLSLLDELLHYCALIGREFHSDPQLKFINHFLRYHSIFTLNRCIFLELFIVFYILHKNK